MSARRRWGTWRTERKRHRAESRAGRSPRRPRFPDSGGKRPGSALRTGRSRSCAARASALSAIAVLVAAASLTSFAESYRGLYDWAHEHGLAGAWAAAAPAGRRVHRGRRAGPVRRAGRRLGAPVPCRRLDGDPGRAGGAVAGNVGHVPALVHRPATAAVPPLAAAAALAVGLGVLKRVVEPHHQRGRPEFAAVPSNVVAAAETSMRATAAAGNPLSLNQLAERFSLTRAQATKVRTAVLAESNGHDTE